ncbi:hypothetical protein EYF80_046618 [Liparis tanakae]|uniref:Uncharacterized protein n=1 Tax=Liparis tanakae TaxID=230148 RepID=A0A4Z2FPQ6_9TELE|nr:hypothetical protein EYF80_046618 [Liparis tanakae]
MVRKSQMMKGSLWSNTLPYFKMAVRAVTEMDSWTKPVMNQATQQPITRVTASGPKQRQMFRTGTKAPSHLEPRGEEVEEDVEERMGWSPAHSCTNAENCE